MSLKDELKEELEKAYTSTLVFAKLFFPDRFYRDFCPIHAKIAGLLDGDMKQVGIIAPRGTGKTSLLDLAYAGKKILFREARFIIMVTSSADAAIQQAENLKRGLASNPLVKELFGDIKSSEWARDRWVVDWKDGDSTMVLPRGSGQQVRGALFGNTRPDLIIVDDLENDEEVMSEVQREKTRNWFFNSLCNCIDRGSRDWKIAVIDTIKHEDCLMEHLVEHSEWHTERLSIFTDDMRSLWPEFIPHEEVAKLYESAKDSGNLDGFYREYMGIPIATESAGFKAEFFKYYEESESELNKNSDIESFVIVDPAKTVNPKSAKTAILGGSVNTKDERIYFRDVVNDFLHPNETITAALDMCVTLHSQVLAIEVTSLNEFITFPFKDEIRRRGLQIELVELKPRLKKEDRAKALIPFYRKGQVYHNGSCMSQLEQQELSFPRPRYWDILDCAAYVVALLDAGGRFLSGVDAYASKEEVEKEFAEVEKEDLYYDDIYDDYGVPAPNLMMMNL